MERVRSLDSGSELPSDDDCVLDEGAAFASESEAFGGSVASEVELARVWSGEWLDEGEVAGVSEGVNGCGRGEGFEGMGATTEETLARRRPLSSV